MLTYELRVSSIVIVVSAVFSSSFILNRNFRSPLADVDHVTVGQSRYESLTTD
jgi:hypothetical protein